MKGLCELLLTKNNNCKTVNQNDHFFFIESPMLVPINEKKTCKTVNQNYHFLSDESQMLHPINAINTENGQSVAIFS